MADGRSVFGCTPGAGPRAEASSAGARLRQHSEERLATRLTRLVCGPQPAPIWHGLEYFFWRQCDRVLTLSVARLTSRHQVGRTIVNAVVVQMVHDDAVLICPPPSSNTPADCSVAPMAAVPTRTDSLMQHYARVEDVPVGGGQRVTRAIYHSSSFPFDVRHPQPSIGTRRRTEHALSHLACRTRNRRATCLTHSRNGHGRNIGKSLAMLQGR